MAALSAAGSGVTAAVRRSRRSCPAGGGKSLEVFAAGFRVMTRPSGLPEVGFSSVRRKCHSGQKLKADFTPLSQFIKFFSIHSSRA